MKHPAFKTTILTKWALSCLFFFFCLAELHAQSSGNYNGFNYISNGTTITITGYTGSGGAVTIPSTINGESVASIGLQAFQFTNVTSITIPASITSIGDYAFAGTSLTQITVDPANGTYASLNGALFNNSLTQLIQYPIGNTQTVYTIPNGVTSIGQGAFDNSKLTSITIPASVTYIVQYAFCQCSNLTSVTIPASVTSIGLEAFLDDTSLTSVNIPSSVSSIGGGAFEGCTSLTSVTIPASAIGAYAFEGCTSLTSLTIGNDGVIGVYAFADCTALTSVNIPSNVSSIDDGAFEGCTSLTNVTMGVASIGAAAFYGTNLTSVYFQSNAPTLGEDAFGDTSPTIYYLENVTGFSSPTWNGYRAILDPVNFKYSSNGDSIMITGYTGTGGAVTIPGTINGLPVTSIGANAFQGCTNLTNANIPNSVTSIGNAAFSGCTSLTSITIGGGVTSIGNDAFNSTSLSNVYFQGNAPGFLGTNLFPSNCTIYYQWDATGFSTPTWMGYNTLEIYVGFTYVDNGTTITIVGYIGGGGALTIPETINGEAVTAIGSSAFSGLTGLTSITIPASVTSVGNSAFSGCTSLTGAYFQGNAPGSFGSNVFNSTASNFTVYYLSSATGFSTPYWNEYPSLVYTPPSPTDRTSFFEPPLASVWAVI